VRATAGLQIFGSGLTVEPLLADAQERLEVTTLPTSARPTLTHVLAGTGSRNRSASSTESKVPMGAVNSDSTTVGEGRQLQSTAG